MKCKRGAVAAVLVFTVMAPAHQVFAHAVLETSVPAPNAVLDAGPPNIVLDFDEEVDAELADIELYDQDAALIPLGSPQRVPDGTVVQASVPTLADGTYVVVWRVPSNDGHVVDGVFSFRVGVGSAVDIGALIDRVGGSATADSIVGRLDTASRLLALIGLIVVIGGGVLAMQWLARATGQPVGQGGDTSSNRLLLWLGWLFLLVGTLGSFGLYGAKVVAGSPGDAVKPSVWAKVVGSHTASVLIVRMLLVLALGVLLLTFARRVGDVWRDAGLAIAVALVLTFSTIGHANTEHPAALWITIDALHLTAVSMWIGGLLMLAFGTRTWLTDPQSANIVRRFSVMSTIAVPVIVVTGAAQTLNLAGRLDDVGSTSWGRTLLVKLAAVAVLVAVGGVSRWLLRNVGQSEGWSALNRTVLAESLIGVAVVGLAAGMIALPPRTVAASKVFAATLTAQGIIADVTITPGRVGENDIHVIVTPPGGRIAAVVSTTAQAELRTGGTGSVPAALQADAPNHYIGTITLAQPGDWNLEVTVEPAAGELVVLSSAVPIPDSWTGTTRLTVQSPWCR